MPAPKKRILFCWELGEGSGHVSPYLGLLAALQDQGWEVALALRNTSVLDAAARARFPVVYQSPICTNAFSGIAPTPANFTELCLGVGYAHRDTLAGLVQAWRSLFDAWQPSLVIANFAPVCLLAAQAQGLARLRMGTGFENPPPAARMPLMGRWQAGIEPRLERAEALARETLNAVLAELGQPPCESLAQVVAEVPTLLSTVPLLDRFRDRDAASVTYLGELPPWAAGGLRPEGEASFFAYLQVLHPAGRAALDALAKAGEAAWVYAPDATEAQCAVLSRGPLRLSREPYDLPVVLPRVRAIVSHAGHGMAMAMLQAGKPGLLLPLQGEQAENARRLEESGAAIVLEPGNKPGKVSQALARLLAEAPLARAAEALAEGHQEWRPGAAMQRAVAACERVARVPGAGLRVVGGAE